MPTDCSTAVPTARPAGAAPRVAVCLHVGLRHAATSLCLRIACLGTTSLPTQDLEHSMAEMLAAADRLLREAGSHKHRITSCELFVRDPSQAADARRMLCGWMAGGLARQQVALPVVHTHSLARPQPGAASAVGQAVPLVEIALVVTHTAGAGTAL